MCSQQAIITPAQVNQFADTLQESVQKLRGEGRKLRDSTKAARAVWKDQKYNDFHKQLESCIENLEKLNSTGTKYCEFLREKASLANRFLHRR